MEVLRTVSKSVLFQFGTTSDANARELRVCCQRPNQIVSSAGASLHGHVAKFFLVADVKGVVEPVEHVDEAGEEGEFDNLRGGKGGAEALEKVVGNLI